MMENAKLGLKTAKITMDFARRSDEYITGLIQAVHDKYNISEDDWLTVEVGLMIVTARKVRK